jgi:hypothetical protein
MAVWYSNELANFYAKPVVKPAANVGVGGRLRRYTATIPLTSQASGDTIIVGQLPSGADFAFGMITATVSLGTATISIGTAAAPAAYKAAATFTTTDTPTLFGTTAQVQAAAYTSEQQIIVTVGAASLPASGTLIIDFYLANA